MGESVRFSARGDQEVEAQLFRPGAEPSSEGLRGCALLLVMEGPDGGPELGSDSGWAEALTAHGVLVLEVVCERDAPDREMVARLDGALDFLAQCDGVDEERVAALGVGDGGTRAFLLACHSSALGAVALVDAKLVYADLHPARPAQPLELALNLGCPLLAFHDPATGTDSVAEIERLEQVLSQFARDFDIVPPTRVGAPGASDATLVARVPFLLSFLARAFDEG